MPNDHPTIGVEQEFLLIDPETGEILTIREQLERLLETIEPTAAEVGSAAHLAFARQMVEMPTEWRWQVAACEGFEGNLH